MLQYDDKAGARVNEIAGEISHYLAKHPSAADSVEGIRRWWLLRQRYEDSAQLVRQALEQLLREGVVSRRVLTDGSVLYTSQPPRSGEEP